MGARDFVNSGGTAYAALLSVTLAIFTAFLVNDL